MIEKDIYNNFTYFDVSIAKEKLLWLWLTFIFLFLPAFAMWDCEAERGQMNACHTALANCLNCPDADIRCQEEFCSGYEFNWDFYVFGGNFCSSVETAYYSCLNQQGQGSWSWGGNWSGNNQWSWWNASWWNASWWSSQWNWWLINCSTSELMSSWWCTTYSSDSSRYCSMNLDGSTATPWLSLYLNHLDPETRDKYDNKFQNQSNRFSKLMEMYNEWHPTAAIEHWAWFAWLEQVWSLNYLMWVYSLSHNDGCKLWNATLNTFFTTNVCALIYGSDSIEAGDEGNCPQGYDPKEYSCCTKSVSCDNPATPQTAEWVCWSWFQNNWSWCCVSICTWENMVYHSLTNTCTWCVEGETKPNESHTRCICDSNYKCCWVQLNTVVPFIWDCIEMNAESNRDTTTNVNSVTAFPILMQWLMKILMSVIMIFSFLMIIVAWLMMVSWAFGWNWYSTWKKIIKNVIISLILLWCSWLILSLVNPSFFGG